MNRPMATALVVAVPSALAAWAYFKYGDTADVIGAAIVGAIIVGASMAASRVLLARRR